MLKYLYAKEVFQEIPSEISLAIAITGCKVHCAGCHSRELWEDKGTPLTREEIDCLLEQHKGVTCLLLMGAEHDIDALIELFQYAHKKIKTAWYCGLDMIPKNKLGILEYLDFIKLGSFDIECGPLNDPNTNQKFYKIKNGKLHDCTSLFWKQ